MFVANTFIKIFGSYAVVGEVLVCAREPNNFQDRYAVTVKKENSAHLIFTLKATHESVLTTNIAQTTESSNGMTDTTLFTATYVHKHHFQYFSLWNILSFIKGWMCIEVLVETYS